MEKMRMYQLLCMLPDRVHANRASLLGMCRLISSYKSLQAVAIHTPPSVPIMMGRHSCYSSDMQLLSTVVAKEKCGKSFFEALAGCVGLRFDTRGLDLSSLARELRFLTAVALHNTNATSEELYGLLTAQWAITVNVMSSALQQLRCLPGPHTYGKRTSCCLKPPLRFALGQGHMSTCGSG